jgi:hypothetical protein
VLIEQDRYVPVFDPEYDTFESIRSRSGMLFDAICTIGCRAENGMSSHSTHCHIYCSMLITI